MVVVSVHIISRDPLRGASGQGQHIATTQPGGRGYPKPARDNERNCFSFNTVKFILLGGGGAGLVQDPF